MRKFFLPSIFIFIVSCGEQAPIEPSSQMERMVGAIRTLDQTEPLPAEEAAIIQSICVNLRNKEIIFNDFDASDRKLVYSGSHRDCGEEEATKQDPFTVEVEASGNGFRFKSLGSAPPFPDVVTTGDVVINKVCDHVANALDQEALVTRVILFGGSPLWISGHPETDPRCVRGDNAECLYIQRGLSIGENRYRVQDAKFFAINGSVGDELRGVALDRRHMRICAGEGASSEARMSFVRLAN